MDALTIGRFLGAAVMVLLVPGSALLAWLPESPSSGPLLRRGLLSKLADAVALSIAIPALLALGLYLAGVQVSGGMVVGMYGACLLFGLAGASRRGIHRGWWKHPDRWAGGLFALLFLAALVAWRLYQSRTLALPNWVDPVQHFLIVRKILEYGGVPPDLAPYLPVPFYYHYGFHLIAALFTFLSGIPVAQVGLWFGQVLNALVAISVYRGAEAFAGSPPAGSLESPQAGLFASRLNLAAPWIVPAFAALLVGFDFQMPAYYLTWGRYTMLAGLLLLGPTLVAVMEVRDQPQRRSAWIRLVLLIAGQGVTHYFVLLLTGFFLLVIGLSSAVRGFRDRGVNGRECWLGLARLVVLAGLGIVLVSPWLLRLLQDNQPVARLGMVNPLDQSEAAQKSMAEYQKYLIYLIGPRRNYILMGLAGVGALVALLPSAFMQPAFMRLAFMRQRLRPLVGWGVLIALLSLPWGPRLGPFRPDHFSIVLFFPAAILLAEFLSASGAVLGRLTRPWVGLAMLGLAGLLFLGWGLRDTRNMVNSDTVLALPADVSALEWIKEHTLPDARFYINGSGWQGDVYRGVDGGSWLLPYSGRFSLVPPISYSWGTADYVQQVNDWARRSIKMEGCNPDFWSLVREANLTHVYLRQGKGSLQPEMLAACQRLRQVYQKDGVFIFEILLPR